MSKKENNFKYFGTGTNFWKIRQEVGNYEIVGHVPRKISWFCHFYINYGGTIEACVRETKYRPSPIPSGVLLTRNDSTNEVFKKMEKFVKDFHVEPEQIKDKTSKDSLKDKEELVTLIIEETQETNTITESKKHKWRHRLARKLRMIVISRLSLLTEIVYSVVFVILPFSNKKFQKNPNQPWFPIIYSCTHTRLHNQHYRLDHRSGQQGLRP